MARWARLTAAIVITIVALAGIARVIPDTAPASDFALIETHVLHVLRGWQPVGAYSRVGGHHPGPLYFQVLAPLYLLSGYRHLGVVLTVAALNVGALIALLLILKRHGTNSAILLAAAVVFGIFLMRVEGLLASIWNPHVAIVPLGLLVVAAAAAANGAYRLIPAVVALASFVIQTHFAFLVPAIAVITGSAILIGLRLVTGQGGDEHRARSYTRPLVIAAAVGVLLWAMPLVDGSVPTAVRTCGGPTRSFKTVSRVARELPHARSST